MKLGKFKELHERNFKVDVAFNQCEKWLAKCRVTTRLQMLK